MTILDYVKDEIRSQRAYKIEHERVPVKLDANECNLPLPPALADEAARSLAGLPLHRYPSGHAEDLAEALAARLGVTAQQIVIANGSNEVIQILLTAFSRRLDADSPPTLVIPVPTFGVYPIVASNLGMRVVQVPLGSDFSLDAGAILASARAERASAVILASPNNPTGNAFGQDAIETVLEGFGGLVVVDEAYFAFCGRSQLPLLARHPNLAVLRTFSKVGLAALRVGYVVTSESVAVELTKVRLPFCLNGLSERVALAAVSHHEEIEAIAARVTAERERVSVRIARMAGVHAFPSEANFILFRTEKDADRVQEEMLGRGVSIRNFNKPGVLENCLRVTIGTPEENDRFLEELERAGAVSGG